MPDDHSEVVPLLPIPNRTVKRLCADDSAVSRVKVGHRQALTAPNTPRQATGEGFGFWGDRFAKCGSGWHGVGLIDAAAARSSGATRR